MSTSHVMALEVSSAVWSDSQALADLASRGNPKSVVESIYSNQSAWSHVVDHIASGNPSWVRAAKALQRGSDAGSSSELRDAMFRALAANPESVLASAEPEFELSRLCGGRTDPLATFEAAAAEYDSTIRAVEAVKSHELSSRRKMCLLRLREGRAGLSGFFNK